MNKLVQDIALLKTENASLRKEVQWFRQQAVDAHRECDVLRGQMRSMEADVQSARESLIMSAKTCSFDLEDTLVAGDYADPFQALVNSASYSPMLPVTRSCELNRMPMADEVKTTSRTSPTLTDGVSSYSKRRTPGPSSPTESSDVSRGTDITDCLFENVRKLIVLQKEVQSDPRRQDKMNELKAIIMHVHCLVCRLKKGQTQKTQKHPERVEPAERVSDTRTESGNRHTRGKAKEVRSSPSESKSSWLHWLSDDIFYTGNQQKSETKMDSALTGVQI